MEEITNCKKKFPVGSLLLWIGILPIIAYLSYYYLKHLNNISYFFGSAQDIARSIVFILLFVPVAIGLFSMFCKTKVVFVCSTAFAVVFTFTLLLSGNFLSARPFASLLNVFSVAAPFVFAFIIFTEAFTVPEPLKKVGRAISFLPSVMIVACAVFMFFDSYKFFYIAGEFGSWINYRSLFEYLAFAVSFILIAVACIFIIRRAAAPYKKIKAE